MCKNFCFLDKICTVYKPNYLCTTSILYYFDAVKLKNMAKINYFNQAYCISYIGI